MLDGIVSLPWSSIDSLRKCEGDDRRSSSSELHDLHIVVTGVTLGGKGKTESILKEAKYESKLEYVYILFILSLAAYSDHVGHR